MNIFTFPTKLHYHFHFRPRTSTVSSFLRRSSSLPHNKITKYINPCSDSFKTPHIVTFLFKSRVIVSLGKVPRSINLPLISTHVRERNPKCNRRKNRTRRLKSATKRSGSVVEEIQSGDVAGVSHLTPIQKSGDFFIFLETLRGTRYPGHQHANPPNLYDLVRYHPSVRTAGLHACPDNFPRKPKKPRTSNPGRGCLIQPKKENKRGKKRCRKEKEQDHGDATLRPCFPEPGNKRRRK